MVEEVLNVCLFFEKVLYCGKGFGVDVMFNFFVIDFCGLSIYINCY